jgi:hypothetical protein
MRLKLEVNEYELNGLKYPPSQIINSQRIEKILKSIVMKFMLEFIPWK